MVARSSSEPLEEPGGRARCRCGHLPTHHMVVVPVNVGGSFRLDPTGPCVLCGEATCRRFTPGPA